MDKLYWTGLPSFTLDTGLYSSDNDDRLEFASVYNGSTAVKTLAKQFNHGDEDFSVNHHYMHTVKNGYRIYTAKIQGFDYMHAILVRKDGIDGNSNIHANVFVRADAHDTDYTNIRNGFPREVLDGLYVKLNGNGKFRGLTSIALLREWMPYLAETLQRNNSIVLCDGPAIVDEEGKRLYCYHLSANDSAIRSAIMRGLKSHVISINGSNEASATIRSIRGLDDYLRTFSTQMIDRVKEQFRPRFVPGEDQYDEATETWAGFVRSNAHKTPYAGQMNTVQSVANCLKEEKFAIICGEMGSGRRSAA